MSDKIDKWIDEALKTEPSFQLRGDFRDRVVKTIRRKEKGSQRRFFFMMALGIVVMGAFGYAIMAYYFPNLKTTDGFSEVNRIIPFGVLLGVIIAGIQYLDKKLVKDRFLTPQP